MWRKKSGHKIQIVKEYKRYNRSKVERAFLYLSAISIGQPMKLKAPEELMTGAKFWALEMESNWTIYNQIFSKSKKVFYNAMMVVNWIPA